LSVWRDAKAPPANTFILGVRLLRCIAYRGIFFARDVGHQLEVPMREVIFVLVLVAVVIYTMMHPDQVQSAIDWFAAQVQSLVDWITGQINR
jgi:hypothetical protein